MLEIIKERRVIMEKIIINIAKEYTKTPGGRHISEGEFSGEDFREKILLKKAQQAIQNGNKLEVILDGGYGYAPSFLEEAFGGLMRKLMDDRLFDIISIISEEEPKLIQDIKNYMREAKG